jgi:uncharacterized cofD-like protein
VTRVAADGVRVVAIGGGHGCARTLSALRGPGIALTAVVSVADDGGSSCRLRRDHAVVALGDLRMALRALAPEGRLRALTGHRFDRGDLAGHSLGNLLLLGLLEQADGDLLVALQDFASLLGLEGRVLPSTTDAVTLRAESASGFVQGQAAVASTSRLHRVHLDPPDVKAPAAVRTAIAAADMIVLGPGSLYTSILPNLLVEDVRHALTEARGRIVLVGNLGAQTGETQGMDLADHLDALHQHVPDLRIDTLVAHVPASADDVEPLAIDLERIGSYVTDVRTADLGSATSGHDPERLGVLLRALLVPVTAGARGV